MQGKTFEGTLPTEIGKICRRYTARTCVVCCSRNICLTIHLFSLPGEGHLTRLEELSFQGCRYSGELPSELGLLTNLEKLLIDRNNFKGTIPVEFDNIADTLNLFLFSSNHFEGTLPYGFCKSDVSLHLDCQVECDCCTDSDCAP